MTNLSRCSSRRQRLDHAFLAQRLRNAKSYKRIAGYFRSSIFELIGEEIASIPKVQIICNREPDAGDQQPPSPLHEPQPGDPIPAQGAAQPWVPGHPHRTRPFRSPNGATPYQPRVQRSATLGTRPPPPRLFPETPAG